MNLKKRGLGRGLEALLADDDSANEEIHQPLRESHQRATQTAAISEPDRQTAIVVSFFKHIQKEHHALLEEAEDLRQLLEEFGDDLA